MKTSIILSLLGAMAPGVLSMPRQVALADHASPAPVVLDEPAWWDKLSGKETEASKFGDAVNALRSGFSDTIHRAEELQQTLQEDLQSIAADIDRNGLDIIDEAGGHKGREFLDLTIYQLVSLSNHTKKFKKYLDMFPDVVKLLNGTNTNATVFVPTDEAFEHVDEDEPLSDGKKAVIKEALLYHVADGLYPAKRILGTHTIPTALEEDFLGGEPQRLRVSVGLTGVKINFYSQVVAVDFVAKNGILHAVRDIIIPPPMAGRELSLFPSAFSTLLLAYEKTDFVKYIHGVKMTGTTVFAPSNGAFAKLGLKANAFLFNTETGLKYLKALLKYQISPNATLYTDAFYDKTGDKDSHIEGTERDHYDLPTLLGDAKVKVDIYRLGGLASMRVNHYINVPVKDGIAKNGVIQVVDKVPLPPHKHKDGKTVETSSEIEVEDLKAMLADYVLDD